jgi:mannose-6-phosphate isomerase-like protein (cupin superfamily)
MENSMIKRDKNNQPANISILPESFVEPKTDSVLFPSNQPRLQVKNTRWIEIPEIIDGKDGILSVAEEHKNIPFSIKRVYYIYGLELRGHIQRGKHAHKTLEQILFCINGSCKVTLHDGSETQEISLCRPNAGIYLGRRVWHVMHAFENNCILLVLASDLFSEEDYIRNYDDYLEHLKH